MMIMMMTEFNGDIKLFRQRKLAIRTKYVCMCISVYCCFIETDNDISECNLAASYKYFFFTRIRFQFTQNVEVISLKKVENNNRKIHKHTHVYQVKK